MKKTTTKPGLTLMRTSERGDFKRCQWLWFVRWVLGLSSNRSPTWAWFGTAIHKALEVRYPVGRKRGHMADVLAAFEASIETETARIYTEGLEPDEEEMVGALELGRAMLLGYDQRWGLDKHWQVIHTEQPFQIDVYSPRTGRLLVVYCGTFDMVVYDLLTKRFYVVDHKTRRRFPSIWSFYDLNDQAGSYLWVGPEVLEHLGVFTKRDSRKVEGIVFNALKKALPDARPRNAEGLSLNKDGTPSARQPGPLFHRYTSRRELTERVRQSQHVLNEAKQMARVRAGIDAPTKNKTEDCVRCPLFDMCQLDEQDIAQAQEYADSGILVYNDPYADHRRDMKRNGVRLTKEEDGVVRAVRQVPARARRPRQLVLPRTSGGRGREGVRA